MIDLRLGDCLDVMRTHTGLFGDGSIGGEMAGMTQGYEVREVIRLAIIREQAIGLDVVNVKGLTRLGLSLAAFLTGIVVALADLFAEFQPVRTAIRVCAALPFVVILASNANAMTLRRAVPMLGFVGSGFGAIVLRSAGRTGNADLMRLPNGLALTRTELLEGNCAATMAYKFSTAGNTLFCCRF